MGGLFLASAADNPLRVGFGQFQVLLVAGDSFLKLADLLARYVADEVAALYPGLMVVIDSGRAGAHPAEFAWLHVLDAGDLFQQQFRFGLGFHGKCI